MDKFYIMVEYLNISNQILYSKFYIQYSLDIIPRKSY